MRLFERNGEHIETEIDADEVDILASLAESLQDLLGGEETSPSAGGEEMDAFAWLAASAESQVLLDHSDPLVERLFPAAYRDDAAASDELRRFSEDEARRARIADARAVRDDLEATERGTQPLRIAPVHTEAWLKTLNAFRLSLAVRLGIADAAGVASLRRLRASDPRAYQVALYEWLGEVLESFLEALYS